LEEQLPGGDPCRIRYPYSSRVKGNKGGTFVQKLHNYLDIKGKALKKLNSGVRIFILTFSGSSFCFCPNHLLFQRLQL